MSVARKLTIQLGVARRLVKEFNSYEAEVMQEVGRLETMRADASVDEYRVRQQEGVVQESRDMVADARRRCPAVVAALEGALAAALDCPTPPSDAEVEEVDQLTEKLKEIAQN